MTESLTANDIVELFRRDARARRELAVLLVSEPEVRLAIINAVLREVATKEDLERLRVETRQTIDELRSYVDQRLEELKKYVDQRIEELREELRDLKAEVRELRERLWWVVATVILGWLAVIVEQPLLYLVAR